MVFISTRERADVLLTRSGLAPSRERARALIMEGCVFIAGVKVDKPGEEFDPAVSFEVRGGNPYVSRGGLKLAKAVQAFGLTLEGKICMDIGASTGGFTDCMLQNGAQKVYAVDVGYGQLAWKLRCDERVICLERTNIRNLTKEQVPEQIDFFSVDVSFISLTLVLPAALPFLKEGGEALCLIKPQFEAGKGKVGKKGVVREPEIHREVIEKILDFAPTLGLSPLHLSYSPIKGPEGNIEYLLHLRRGPAGEAPLPSAAELVRQSHEALDV